MKEILDLQGLACPEPVIRTKKAIESGEMAHGFIVTVDNEVAWQNVERFVKSMGFQYASYSMGHQFFVDVEPYTTGNTQLEEEKPSTAIVVTSEVLGTGDNTLGEILMKSYFYALKETKPLPRAIIFLNSGVKLTATESDTTKYIIELEKQGVEVLSCGTCLDYYGLKDDLAVGKISNIYTIIEMMNQCSKVVNL